MRDGADGRNHSGRAAAKRFVGLHGKVGSNLAFDHFVAHVACKLDDGVSRDAGKDGTGQFGGVEHLVLDAEEIGSAHFFDVGVRFCVEVNHLCVALGFRFLAGLHARSVVSDGFDTARSRQGQRGGGARRSGGQWRSCRP